MLCETNKNMAASLQDKSVFCLLGHCSADDISTNGSLDEIGTKTDDTLKSLTSKNANSLDNRDIVGNKFGQFISDFPKLDGLLHQHRCIGNNWVQLVCHSREKFGNETFWIPKLHHICWNGQIESQCNVHLILYETPTFGAHHFSLNYRSFEQTEAPLRKPKWVDELHRKQPLCDLETVILGINSAIAARMLFQKQLDSKRSFSRFLAFLWHIFSISVASLSTILYVILQSLCKLLSYVSSSWIYTTSTKGFNTTMQNIQIRCSQILYWPIFLQDKGLRSLSCVEYAENAALQRHFIWSSLSADVLLGNLFGFALLCHAESASLWVLNFADDFTNNLLRSGCVWLMGVPAGFKLNTELAGVLGIVSLNAIQIWSTLWVFLGFHVIFFIKALAILGIVFGATIPAAMVIDIIALAMLHVSTIHCFISILYSTQIQVIASLWRLFRGQKWNPLRKRLDSYDYTVKQHIVGSLLFAPLLLLLPTTSVFYIFFSILDTTISLIRILIGTMISVIHATPYVKIFLRLVKPRRFPSGIWFDIVTCRGKTSDSSDDVNARFEDMERRKDTSNNKNSSFMVSFLRSNFMTPGQLVLPHYRNVLSGVSRSSIAASAYGVLTGKRIGSTLVAGFPSPMPWMSIPCKEYWRLCRDSVMECH